MIDALIDWLRRSRFIYFIIAAKLVEGQDGLILPNDKWYVSCNSWTTFHTRIYCILNQPYLLGGGCFKRVKELLLAIYFQVQTRISICFNCDLEIFHGLKESTNQRYFRDGVLVPIGCVELVNGLWTTYEYDIVGDDFDHFGTHIEGLGDDCIPMAPLWCYCIN